MIHKLNNVALKLLEQNSIGDLYKNIFQEVVKLVKVKHVSIYLSQNNRLKRVYSTIPEEQQVKLRRNGYTYSAYKTKQIQLVTAQEVLRVHQRVSTYKIKTVLLIPLTYRNRCIGVLSVDSSQEKFSDEELAVLKLFASMATLTINRLLMQEENDRALSIRQQFIAHAAHEFRTPLTTIQGYSQMIKRKISSSDERIVKWLHSIENEVGRLIQLTNELVDASHMHAGTAVYSLQTIDLNTILNTVQKRFTFAHPDRILHVVQEQTDTQRPIVGDTNKLLQVFDNILENAVNFSPEALPITMEIRDSETWYTVIITDKGIGIAPEEIEKIFEGFYKSTALNEVQGMGVGLYMSKKIIEAHRGKLSIRSKLGKGTRVILKLPALSYE